MTIIRLQIGTAFGAKDVPLNIMATSSTETTGRVLRARSAPVDLRPPRHTFAYSHWSTKQFSNARRQSQWAETAHRRCGLS